MSKKEPKGCSTGMAWLLSVASSSARRRQLIQSRRFTMECLYLRWPLVFETCNQDRINSGTAFARKGVLLEEMLMLFHSLFLDSKAGARAWRLWGLVPHTAAAHLGHTFLSALVEKGFLF